MSANTPHGCPNGCAANICKGQVIDAWYGAPLPASAPPIIYIGDGNNDWCPASRLRSTDHILARRGYPLERRLQKAPVRGTVMSWSTGTDVLSIFEQLIK